MNRSAVIITLLSTAVLLSACANAESASTDRQAVSNSEPPTYPIADSLFGAVIARAQENCLQTVAQLEPGRDVQVILPDREVSFHAKVGKLYPACGDGVSTDRNAYLLETYDLVPGDFGIALMVPDVRITNARTDIDGDGRHESYRFCTSTEGVHFTAWSGEWFENRRIWHDYYYLGYDMIGTCSEPETAS
jgi:hypothetical protein